ncbi:MAG: tRNA pseudouridine(13) synthase TruD, partial [Candidatus Aenigmarchaeota archaeon]|nr:tRNA pseudouridine(13) synthase TruD [Candidatus Aenigmarchaeota archaeon]NIQ17771.1 tRNA pseudouridine(13) synthase TruD [Candidatus Aenigmarchaeota archaeon]NIS73091.1 tRNA pseudouridine(13) synthase TruD [Candidatus Aenigmarchaeota archaeon]
MPRIKQLPEDFIVKEVFEKQKTKEEEKVFYVWFTLRKKNWDLFRALNILSKKLGVSIKRFGYAGVKDKRAITYQRISVWNVPVERLKGLKIRDLELSDFEIKRERINLGDLRANRFEVVIRDIGNREKEKIEKNLERIGKEGFVNYFGEQRFGLRKNTHLVGKAILRNRLKEAVWVYLTKGGEENEEARKFRANLRRTKDFKRGLKDCPKNLRNEIVLMNHLTAKPNDYAGALRKIPKKFRRMFVHAYQSYL